MVLTDGPYPLLYTVPAGTRLRSWLRHCATRRKVAVSISRWCRNFSSTILPATLDPWGLLSL